MCDGSTTHRTALPNSEQGLHSIVIIVMLSTISLLEIIFDYNLWYIEHVGETNVVLCVNSHLHASVVINLLHQACVVCASKDPNWVSLAVCINNLHGYTTRQWGACSHTHTHMQIFGTHKFTFTWQFVHTHTYKHADVWTCTRLSLTMCAVRMCVHICVHCEFHGSMLG